MKRCRLNWYDISSISRVMREIGNGQSVRPYVQFFRKTGYVFQNQRIVSPRKQDAWTDAVWIFQISTLFLEIWGRIENVSLYVRTYVRNIKRSYLKRKRWNLKKNIYPVWRKILNGRRTDRPFPIFLHILRTKWDILKN